MSDCGTYGDGGGVPVTHHLATTDGPQTVLEITSALDADKRTVRDTLLKLQAQGYADCRIRPRPGEDGDHPREWRLVDETESERERVGAEGVAP